MPKVADHREVSQKFVRTQPIHFEPLFFGDDKGHYFRDPDVNHVSTAERALSSRSAAFGFHPARVTYGCLWTGEVHCLLSIMRTFRELGAPLEIRIPRVCSWAELKQTSLILPGNSQTNSILKSLAPDSPFVARGRSIENKKPEGAEKRLYRTRRRGCPNLEIMPTYALVTRRPGIKRGSVVTMIAGDHCRAIEGAGHFLTQENGVGSLLERMKLRSACLPGQFQIILRVETVDTTREIASVECEVCRVLRIL